MLSKDLLNILACPSCKGELQTDEAQQQLFCHACSLAFPVRAGIPVLLLDQALPIDQQSQAAAPVCPCSPPKDTL